MNYKIIPQEKMILLEKIKIEQIQQEALEGFFIPEDFLAQQKNENEIFEIADCSKTNIELNNKDWVIVKNPIFIGFFNEKEFFIAHENQILAQIIKN